MTSGARGTVYVASHLVPDASKEFSPGAVAVADGMVVTTGSPADVERRIPAGFDRRDFPGLAIIPGLVNAHSHLSIPRLAGREGTLSSSSDPARHRVEAERPSRGVSPERGGSRP